MKAWETLLLFMMPLDFHGKDTGNCAGRQKRTTRGPVLKSMLNRVIF